MFRLIPFFLALSFLLVLPGPALAQSSSGGVDPVEIINRVDRLLRGDSSFGVAVMSIVTKRWERSKTLEIWSRGTQDALIRIRAPKKEAGVATLKVGTDIWNYLPKIDRTIRIPSSMMMASWMGSHFSNDDLVKESQLVRDYTIEVSYDGPRDGLEVWEFKLTPKEDAAVVWGAIEFLVRQKDLMPLESKYYGEDGELKRVMTFSDFKVMGGRLVPARMKLVPTDAPEERTEFFYEELKFDIALPEDTFSLSNLRKRQ